MKKFMILWSGELISSIGSGMTAFALSIYVYQLSKSAGAVSLTVLASFLPSVLLSPLGGVLADIYDRRYLMIIGESFSGLGLLFMLYHIHFYGDDILPILIGTAFNGIFVALMEPSFKATLTDVLSEEDYQRAAALVQMIGGARYLISPFLAAFLLSFSDIRLIIVFDICTFFVTAVCVFLVRKSIERPLGRKSEGILVELKEGFLGITSNEGIFSLVLFMAFVCFCVGFLQTLIVPLILSSYSAKTLGILESICAAGMLIGSVFAGLLDAKKAYVRTLRFSGMAASVFIVFSGVSTKIYFTGLCIFLFFMSLPFMNTAADVLVRNTIRNDLQGRAWGIIGLLSQAGTAFSYAVSGVLADRVFEPLFKNNGLLTKSIGRLIGVGEGRGIGFMLVLSGLGMLFITYRVGKNSCLSGAEEGIIFERESQV